MGVGQPSGTGDGSCETGTGFLRDDHLVSDADARRCGRETTGDGCIGTGIAQLDAITAIGKGSKTAGAVTADLVTQVV